MKLRKNKAALIALTILVAATAIFAVEVTDRNKIVMIETMKYVNQIHYNPHEIDNELSERVFDMYLDRLDYRKRFLLKSDVDKFAKMRDEIDDQINSKDLSDKFEFYVDVNKAFEERLDQVDSFYKELLAKPFNYYDKDSLETDGDKSQWCSDMAHLKERWRKLLEYQTLTRYFMLKETADSIGTDEDEVDEDLMALFLKNGKLDPDLEKEARQKVEKATEMMIKRLRDQNTDDRFAIYMNSILNSLDPHTTYMPPKAEEDFNIDMTGQFEGIGARLSQEDGYIKVTEIIPGSASWRQGELEPEDLIIKVAQGNEEPIDVVDMPVDDAVTYIRGKKGTEVRLTVKKATGEIKVIPIIRDVVVIEETYAKAAVLNDTQRNKRYGYVRLPGFYRDFQNKTNRNSTDDVAQAIDLLKDEDIDGMILDLRNNGGGALQDAVSIGGLFIEQGPIVQVSDKIRGTRVHADFDKRVQYDGPLVVLVNQFSASASEILSAALQDYNRAVIIGPKSSFGKGTVQNLNDLDRYVSPIFEYLKPLGSLKLTIQKFYRIDGTTTQYKGVIPDVVVPCPYDYIDIGEREYDYALPYDTIEPAKYDLWKKGKMNDSVVSHRSQARTEENEAFTYLEKRNEALREEREQTRLSLNVVDMIQERQKNKEYRKKMESYLVEREGLDVTLKDLYPPEEEKDASQLEQEQNLITNLKKDIYVTEATFVLDDLNEYKAAMK